MNVGKDETQLVYRILNLAQGLGYDTTPQRRQLLIQVALNGNFTVTLHGVTPGITGEGQGLRAALGVLVARLEARVGTRIGDLEDLLRDAGGKLEVEPTSGVEEKGREC